MLYAIARTLFVDGPRHPPLEDRDRGQPRHRRVLRARQGDDGQDHRPRTRQASLRETLLGLLAGVESTKMPAGTKSPDADSAGNYVGCCNRLALLPTPYVGRSSCGRNSYSQWCQSAPVCSPSRRVPSQRRPRRRRPLRQGSTPRSRATRSRCCDEGRKTFRFDTFGSEAFWGDALRLHKAIAGEKNGGVGPGVTPKTALSVGLKVDADALPAALVAAAQGRQGRPRRSGDDARAAQAERGRRRHRRFDSDGGVTVDRHPVRALPLDRRRLVRAGHRQAPRRLAEPRSERRRDRVAGAQPQPFTDLLGVDAATVKKVLASWGPGRYDACWTRTARRSGPTASRRAR